MLWWIEQPNRNAPRMVFFLGICKGSREDNLDVLVDSGQNNLVGLPAASMPIYGSSKNIAEKCLVIHTYRGIENLGSSNLLHKCNDRLSKPIYLNY